MKQEQESERDRLRRLHGQRWSDALARAATSCPQGTDVEKIMAAADRECGIPLLCENVVKLTASQEQVRSSAVELGKASGQSGLVWVNVCRECTLKSRDMVIDKSTFEGLIGNLHADSRYPAKRAASGFNETVPMIPFDVNHASEQAQTRGTLENAQAIGWVYDLRMRFANDEWRLDALTKWSDEARDVIRRGGLRYASISFIVNAISEETGEEIGPLATSIAATNQPAVSNLEPLTASRFGAGGQPTAGDTRTRAREKYAAVLAQAGRNPLEQCIEHVRLTTPGADKWREQQLFDAGLKLYREMKDAGAVDPAPQPSSGRDESTGPKQGVQPGSPINLRMMPGRNAFEQVRSHILATVPGADKWSGDDLWTATCKLFRELKAQGHIV